MTVKDIADTIGKPLQTVRNWTRILASKSDAIKSKLDSGSPMKPSKWNLAEVCQIIEEGLGRDVADTFRTNAVDNIIKSGNGVPDDKKSEIKSARYSAAYIREVRINAGIEAARALIAANGDLASKPAPLQIEAPKKLPDHIARQVYAVAVKAIEKENQKLKERGEPQLFT